MWDKPKNECGQPPGGLCHPPPILPIITPHGIITGVFLFSLCVTLSSCSCLRCWPPPQVPSRRAHLRQAPHRMGLPSQSLRERTPTRTPSKVPEKAHDYAQESFVIEQMHSRYRFEADGTGRKELTARIRVQSEAGV